MAFGVAADFECPLAGRQQRNRLYVEMYAYRTALDKACGFTQEDSVFRRTPFRQLSV
jgi:hypothetical protein